MKIRKRNNNLNIKHIIYAYIVREDKPFFSFFYKLLLVASLQFVRRYICDKQAQMSKFFFLFYGIIETEDQSRDHDF